LITSTFTSGTKELDQHLLDENGAGTMKDVVIEVNKGTVTGIYSDANLRFVVVDWDLRERVEPEGTLGFEVERSTFREMSQETLIQYRHAAN